MVSGEDYLDERAQQQAGGTGEQQAATTAELCTDASNADRLVQRYGKDLAYVPAWGWLVWSGTHWSRDELKARALMLDTARAIHHEAAATSDRQAQDALSKWARQSQNAQRIGAALWCAQPALAAQADDFDNEPMLLPVANGTLDLRSGALHEHRREHRLTRLAPVYYDPQAEAPTWQAFLERVLPDAAVRAFVQRLAGYTLTGSTAEQVLAFLYGTGRNGKSVFLETLAAMIGDYHKATRIDTLSITRGGGIPNDVAALAGARMVTVSETPEGARLNESLVKDMTGGDTITARFMRREFFDFRPAFTIWVRGNHKPQIRGTDDGIWRRVLLVPFTEYIRDDEIEPELGDKLRDELAGVLRWALDGCLAWQRDGLRPPQRVREAVREYRDEMDTFGQFIDEQCVVAEHASARASELYAAYKRWSDAAGEQPVSQRRFGEALAERGFERRKGGAANVYHWHGIGLVTRDCPACGGEGDAGCAHCGGTGKAT